MTALYILGEHRCGPAYEGANERVVRWAQATGR
jgi:hypothetical protein